MCNENLCIYIYIEWRSHLTEHFPINFRATGFKYIINTQCVKLFTCTSVGKSRLLRWLLNVFHSPN